LILTAMLSVKEIRPATGRYGDAATASSRSGTDSSFVDISSLNGTRSVSVPFKASLSAESSVGKVREADANDLIARCSLEVSRLGTSEVSVDD
jgi:hypothetical protein